MHHDRVPSHDVCRLLLNRTILEILIPGLGLFALKPSVVHAFYGALFGPRRMTRGTDLRTAQLELSAVTVPFQYSSTQHPTWDCSQTVHLLRKWLGPDCELQPTAGHASANLLLPPRLLFHRGTRPRISKQTGRNNQWMSI